MGFKYSLCRVNEEICKNSLVSPKPWLPRGWRPGSSMQSASACGRSLPEGGTGLAQHREEPHGERRAGGPRELSRLSRALDLQPAVHPASLTPCSSSGDRHAECPQESAPSTSAASPWGGPAPYPDPSSPESDSRGPGSRPSSESSPEGSPRPWGQQAGSILPMWTPDAPRPSLLETGGAEPSSLERAAPESGGDVKSEGASKPDVHRTSAEG